MGSHSAVWLGYGGLEAEDTDTLRSYSPVSYALVIEEILGARLPSMKHFSLLVHRNRIGLMSALEETQPTVRNRYPRRMISHSRQRVINVRVVIKTVAGHCFRRCKRGS